MEAKEISSEANQSAPGGLSMQEVLDSDIGHEIPAPLRFRRTVDMGSEPVPADRYVSKDFFAKEVEKVWLKAWQYAVREEEIPNPGDTYVYEIVGKSLLVIRQQDGSIRAFQNVCLHRGRKLATSGGCKSQLICPYHGFTWNTDGSFKHNPFSWDFKQIDESNFSLPEARVECWAGFVFVNFDLNAPPLASLLGEMPKHFEHWRIDECYKAAHIRKVMPANWKACSEAFLEAAHIITTHPQFLPYSGFDLTQYDVVSDHVTRFVSPVGFLGPHSSSTKLTEEQRIRAMMGVGSRAGIQGKQDDAEIAEGATLRSYMADVSRKNLREETGYDFSDACDSDVIDGISYDIFPNFHLWGGFSHKICYRFRPLDCDPERTIADVMLFKLKPKGENPPPAEVHELDEDQPWADATGLAYLGPVFDQDHANVGPQQAGLRDLATTGGALELGRSFDMRGRHLHHVIDQYMAR